MYKFIVHKARTFFYTLLAGFIVAGIILLFQAGFREAEERDERYDTFRPGFEIVYATVEEVGGDPDVTDTVYRICGENGQGSYPFLAQKIVITLNCQDFVDPAGFRARMIDLGLLPIPE